MEEGRTTWLVEVYMSSSNAERVRRAIARARAAANDLARGGAQLRFVRSTYVAEDETCFLVYESASAELVRQACLRAGVPSDRVLAAVELTGHEERE